MIRKTILLVAASLMLASCAKTQSSTTGWAYNKSNNGGFQINLDYKGQEAGPGLVFVEGGTFVMGRVEEDFQRDWNNQPSRVTVASFYMDESEVTNADYREYLYWVRRVYDYGYYPQIYQSALPDTLVWRNKLGYNETYVENYLRHPAYNFYPVVGVSWEQAMRYCSWRTDRVNEQILIDKGILNTMHEQQDDQSFNTEVYLYKGGEYTQQNKRGVKDLNPNTQYGKEGRPARIEDGILLPKYRLPTEAEWEYAAYAEVGNRVYNRTVDRNKYSWNGSTVRNGQKGDMGDMLANYKRGGGDNMGIGGYLNDQANITMQVKFYPPNDFGLYDMAGNVAEWVLDVYRPLSGQDMADHRPFRGNEFTQFDDNYEGLGELAVLVEPQYKLVPNQDGGTDSVLLRLPGQLPIRDVAVTDNLTRRNYKKSDYRNFQDGDVESSISYDKGGVTEDDNPMYQYADKTLIGNNSRVFKGGSWKDRAYWLSPGARRHLEQDQSTDFIGFRCAMDRLGFQNESSDREKEQKKVKADKFRRYQP
ncbi:MAG: SUMF1/EgtB/PvdO family nonheme iron enzyme [Schleiferiaceae bacterium]|jgi:gliding motility-associated lipoprotein GldJ|nr:SUMF1/EgtB/PvdO family nonheme iron enzyme [Flavobacteriales bacterium]MDG1006268.1 SUMF1/EgtB/PvdO family nonheme iron enzyme [Schleiferiaceae bacterium]MDG1219774.1 SUMF1/EgtB/PvdO family nonheme iron enzyme [Schleiferiaceae bacterium]MDG1758401.1 SUMF1/EgtB/PvdO family nonheme iron enzyme [Schleiferiaceae bacterium]MDG2225845.1 SUMF1/EgtB/PvdO family nonheme iron enzyme [Schleiferiaceae bacterium]